MGKVVDFNKANLMKQLINSGVAGFIRENGEQKLYEHLTDEQKQKVKECKAKRKPGSVSILAHRREK